MGATRGSVHPGQETQSGEIPAGRGEPLEHDGETFLQKLPFFTCGARETQSSNLRDCQNHEPLGGVTAPQRASIFLENGHMSCRGRTRAEGGT